MQSTAKDIMLILGIKNPPELTTTESMLLIKFVSPSKGITFNSITGYEKIKTVLRRRIIYPMMFKTKSKMLHPPKGLLLYGSSGNGKTMFAQALVSNSGCRCLNVDMSIIMSKFFGESQKMVNSLFSLAKKLEPVIIFIDDIESFLRIRNVYDNECSTAVKAQFMSQWDGILENNSKIIIVATSNMPLLIDPSILRRMPLKILIDFPDDNTKIDIIRHFLPCIYMNEEMINILQSKTKNFSCTDIIELCRMAIFDQNSNIFNQISEWKKKKE
uniref:AAA domain-containing protein n=1 Tax=Parastrongyloides trichosuri TaxID=131310 RepID=A0A0N4ZTA3_PARTI